MGDQESKHPNIASGDLPHGFRVNGRFGIDYGDLCEWHRSNDICWRNNYLQLYSLHINSQHGRYSLIPQENRHLYVTVGNYDWAP